MKFEKTPGGNKLWASTLALVRAAYRFLLDMPESVTVVFIAQAPNNLIS
jgi:hypothetical protein